MPLDPSTLPEPVDVSDNVASLEEVDRVIAGGPFDAEWTSLRQYRIPRWYEDAKFGIFLHWGVYTVPAFRNEWYPRNAYIPGSPEYQHHLERYGAHREFGYKDFIPEFRMERFEPERWAQLFRQSGAQFVMPVAEHHDGFAMYASARTRWTAARVGPARDVFGELVDAVRRAGMVAAASSHRAEHWFFLDGGTTFDSDVLDPRFADFYGPAQPEQTTASDAFLQDWLLRTVEIIDRYRPQVLWFDGGIQQPGFEPYVRKLAAYYYNRAAEWGAEVVINYKGHAFPEQAAVLDIERGAMAGVRSPLWQNDTSISRNSWSWHPDQIYKSLPDLIGELADVVAKNGVLLLNLCPRSDGTFDDREVELVRGMGRWLAVNGRAIYGTRPYVVPSEGPTAVRAGSFVDDEPIEYTERDIRFTRRADPRGEHLYAILLRRPESGVARIRTWGADLGVLTDSIRSVDVLGSRGETAWRREPDALEVVLPEAGTDLPGAVVEVTLAPPSDT